MSQTVVKDRDDLHYGSGKVEISSNAGGAWTDLGVGNKVGLEEKIDITETIADNGGKIDTLVKSQEMTLKINLLELNLAVMNSLRGIDTLTPIAAAPVAVTNEAHGTGWTQGKPIQLDYKNGANTIVASIVVKGGGSALVLNTDYRTYVGDGENGVLGYTYITPISAQAGAITADYTYTPNASETLSSGGKIRMNEFWVRLTSIDPITLRQIQVTMYKCSLVDGFKFDFSSDEDVKAIEVPITLKAALDVTRTAGDQLYSINRTAA